MADPKKMSVADILAAARKADAKGGAAPASKPTQAEKQSTEPPPESQVAPAGVSTTSKPAAGGKPSVADVLAMARAQKAGGAASAPAVKQPTEEKLVKAPKGDAVAVKAAKPTAKQAEAPGAAPVEMETSSILAAVRKADKHGPLSKAEAAAKATAVAAPAKPAKEKVVAPPMPAKPAYAKHKEAPATEEDRRGFMTLMLGTALGIGFTAMATVGGLWSLAFARFMFPNVLMEPPSRFKVGFPANFPPGTVDEKFKAQFGVWIVNAPYNGQQQIVALRSVCTHLGCTPNWLDGEQKFKCPCHGSGFYKDGINFEGPAPRPLERYAISLADDGQLEVDKSKLFQEELGQWANPACFVLV